MLYRDISRILGLFIIGIAIALGIPFLLAGYYQFFSDQSLHPQPHTTIHFFWSIFICLALGTAFYYLGRKSSGHLYRREGILCVVLMWFITPALASLPFCLSGTLENPLCAYFEMSSGFTTTGSTTLEAKRYDPQTGQEIPINREICGAIPVKYAYYGTIKPVKDPTTGKVLHEGIEAIGKGLLFWRSFTQWLGGVGIVVLFVAVLPALGVGGRVLFKSEVGGPIKDALTPRIKETALNLWKIYLGLTVLQVIFLMGTNVEMGLYDALTITFSTLATGGFTVKNASIGAYANANTEWVVITFMILGGTNFALYYYLLRGKLYRLYDAEFILYLLIILLTCGFTAWYIVGIDKIFLTGENAGVFSSEEAIRHGTFQLVSSLTSTGFATVDYERWPYAVQALMCIVMFVGAMSGSTAGGIKTIRHYMLFKIIQYKVESVFRPETVRSFKLGDKVVDPGVATMTLCFFVIVIVISALGMFLLILDGIDPESSFSLVTQFVNNVGMGFRMASPTASCAFLSDFGLALASFLMIIGRLEYFAILAILVPAFWKKNE